MSGTLTQTQQLPVQKSLTPGISGGQAFKTVGVLVFQTLTSGETLTIGFGSFFGLVLILNQSDFPIA